MREEGGSCICLNVRCGVRDVSGDNSEAVISGADGSTNRGIIAHASLI
jgi:hypothetical protein